MTDKSFYSYSQDKKAVAFIDILGFSHLTGKGDDGDHAMLTFTLLENCVLPYRNSMKEGIPQFSREIPADLNHSGHRDGFWYKEIPEGAVNFVYLSDSLILYSNSLTHLFRELSAIFGAAIIFGVPIRAGISMGDIHHSEWIERPGTGICLYGSALILPKRTDS